MNGVLELFCIGGGGGLLFLLTLLCFSLRDFSRSRLEEICRQNGKPDRFSHILHNYEKTLLLTEFVLLLTLLASSWAASKSAYFGDMSYPQPATFRETASWATSLLAILVTASFVLVALPWTISRVAGEAYLFRAWSLVNLLCKVGSPIWKAALQLDRIVHRVFGVPEPDSEAAANLLTDELLTVIDESRREGVIHSSASTMIHRVVDLQTEDVAAIMTPRTDMVTIDADLPLMDAYREMVENGCSRVPVIRDGIDDIVGILYARDLLAFAIEAGGTPDNKTTADIARDVLYVPESQGIGDLLESMQVKKVHMAIVVDEYSGVSGLVTLEDILEEIVGEISDEYDDKDESLWKQHQDGRTEVDARYHLDDLNEEFGYDLPEDEEFDTIGGFALSCFGRIPAVGEEYFWKELKLTVLDADERRLIRVRIEGTTAESRQIAKEAEGLA